MDHPLETLIDRQVRRAQMKGELENLPGQGEPLNLGSGKPSVEETILKANNVAPPGAVERCKAQELRSKLARTTDPDRRKEIMRKISDLDLRVALELESLRRFA